VIQATRLLGLAFASADFLAEVDAEGTVLFATGASSVLGDTIEAMIGRPGGDFFAEPDAARFKRLVRDLCDGGRAGPVPMVLKSGGKAMLSLCRLPQNEGRVSCVLAFPGSRSALPASGTDHETGLADQEAFMRAAAPSTGSDASLALVNLPNLPQVCAALSAEESKTLLSRMGDAIRSMGALAMGRVSPTGFGVVTAHPDDAKTLALRIGDVIRERGIESLEVEEVLVSLKTKELTREQNMLALRHVIGRFAENKLDGPHPVTLGHAFDAMVSETLVRAQKFNATVADGAFDLAFEPIVDLNTGAVSHYEVLSRFQAGQSPADTMRFAEELGMSDSFDLSVAVKVFQLLESNISLPALAMNFSGRSISSPTAFALLAGLLMRKRNLARRVSIEITETAEMLDLAAADKAVQAMRHMGYRVGIDDFGAGAASLQYLHGFTVDFVKVDGAMIQRIGKSPREDVLLRGVVTTCRDLGIATIAEWIDSDEKLQLCREMGFVFGQGRLFGSSLGVLPLHAPNVSVRPARRAG